MMKWKGVVEAIEQGRPDVLQSKFDQEPGLIQERLDRRGSTALHHAAANGHANIAAILIQRGADINATNYDGWTPLHLVAHHGHDDVGLVLLQNGANIDAVNAEGWTALAIASHIDQLQMVKLLVAHGANLNIVCNDGRAPLYLAAMRGHSKTCQELLRAGANTEMSPKSSFWLWRGMTACNIAQSRGYVDVVAEFDQEHRRRLFRGFLLGTLRRRSNPSLVAALPVDVLGLIASHALKRSGESCEE
eukprot:c18494_g1_i1.p1 GENE.c18494_g1_i1~~c18494_g1_i1.p1  ORF type:complete len:259 (+),score=41.25 c18494_g1_i1:37-777(+)